MLGYQMGAAYVNNDLMSDLYVMRMVSFCWPQVVPARALMMLRRGVMRDMRDEMCWLKVRCGSKVTPKIRGFLSRGKRESQRGTWG